MLIQTSELIDDALNWAISKGLGLAVYQDDLLNGKTMPGFWFSGVTSDPNYWVRLNNLNWSTNWSQAGPIIDREGITIVCARGDYNQSKAGTNDCYDTYWIAVTGRQTADTVYGPQGDDWGNQFQIDEDEMQGPTPLVAAMRCFVASKLGEEVDVPDELCTQEAPVNQQRPRG